MALTIIHASSGLYSLYFNLITVIILYLTGIIENPSCTHTDNHEVVDENPVCNSAVPGMHV